MMNGMEQARGKRNLLERLIDKIPGFKSFQEREIRREVDKLQREWLSDQVDRVRSAGIDISLSGVNRSVMKVLKQTHLIVKIGEDHFYPTIDEAINAVHKQAHAGGDEKNCPLVTVCRIPQSPAKMEN